MHTGLELAHLDAAVLIRHQREVTERLRVVPARAAWAVLNPGFVKRGREEYGAAEELTFDALRGRPCGLEGLVRLPELTGLEQDDGRGPVRVLAGGRVSLRGFRHDASIRASARGAGSNVACVAGARGLRERRVQPAVTVTLAL